MLFFIKTGAHCISQAGFDLIILLLQPFKCWYYGYLPLAHRACPRVLLSVKSPSGLNIPERFPEKPLVSPEGMFSCAFISAFSFSLQKAGYFP